MVDGFGRVHKDLRISVTDRCNFRCIYCMPAEGLQWLPRHHLLTFEEIERIAALMVRRFGITSIRLTGGEPTVRANLEVLVEKLAALGVDLALTTNGATLGLLAHKFVNAGLHRINISLDSLRPDRFERLTRRNELHRVLDGIDTALAAGLNPVKINVVVVRGVNDDEIVDFARFGRARGAEVRFIEFMPLDADEVWSNNKVVPLAEIVDAVAKVFPLVSPLHSQSPAAVWHYADGQGSFGVIASVTHAFCGSCDRVRLTAEGMFRNCLFATDEHDLKALLRSGASDDVIVAAIAKAVSQKWAGHAINQTHFIRPARSMSQIGG
ncbi:MAG: GTP 3',8-cyclase MoaA [Acidimicrobiia bacterium]|nr:GTP 3',8-cyclase MoaA [Acidimicrobiia bacterium]MYC57034.1 GTP 3',8-cyclase MoaA [Acidimicrobiia bacterium]MYG93541.1 GTP 3',8-cyclase MoaA [Acidimicrobiia bacterium]MYI31103.1 GTP 3',8-cyclase MoaA [Acidimicrobiia bacterium]